MTRADYLNGRAALLRRVAKTIDVRSIRDRILALADECVQLAKLVEKTTIEKQAGASSARSPTLSRSQPQAKREVPRTRTAQQTRG
jgi:hypothetical protein